jgi:dihydroflavonol-4-reductase
MIKLFGASTSAITAIRNKQPLISNPVAHISCDSHFFCSDKAVAELMLPQTPIETGIVEAYTWFRSNGFV